MSPRLPLLLITAALLTGGCHAKFKKHASSLGAVHAQPVVTTGPYVQLGLIHDDSLLAAIVNTVQTIKSYDVAMRLTEAVQVDGVNDAFLAGVRDTLGGGPPFAYSDDPSTPLLQAEVLGYGLDVPGLGAPGMFTYQLRVKIYDTTGDRVYKVLHSCATGVGSPDPAAEVLLVVNNLEELAEMSDAEIQQAFEGSAYYCGVDLVRKIRKHAG